MCECVDDSGTLNSGNPTSPGSDETLYSVFFVVLCANNWSNVFVVVACRWAGWAPKKPADAAGRKHDATHTRHVIRIVVALTCSFLSWIGLLEYVRLPSDGVCFVCRIVLSCVHYVWLETKLTRDDDVPHHNFCTAPIRNCGRSEP